MNLDDAKLLIALTVTPGPGCTEEDMEALAKDEAMDGGHLRLDALLDALEQKHGIGWPSFYQSRQRTDQGKHLVHLSRDRFPGVFTGIGDTRVEAILDAAREARVSP